MTENLIPFKGQNQNSNNNNNDNRHIVDKLADVRDQIAYLKGVEETLKEQVSRLMGSRMSLGGDEYIATKIIAWRKGAIDAKLLEADGIDIEKYRKAQSSSMSIRIEERKVIA